MQDIQQMCLELSSYHDAFVVAASENILRLYNEVVRQHSAELNAKFQEITSLQEQVDALHSECAMLKFQLQNSNKALYGRRSEKTAGDGPNIQSQQSPAVDKAEQANEDDPHADHHERHPRAGSNNRHRKGKAAKPFPAHIPREIVKVPIDPKTLCQCGCGRRQLPPTIQERLEFVPAKLIVIREEHERSACKNCNTIAYAKAPERIFDGSRYGATLYIAAAMDKYADGLPHHRQSERFRRMGIDLDRSTLMRMAARGATALSPIYDLMLKDVLGSQTLHMDETTLPMLDPGRGRVKLTYIWTLARDQRGHSGNEPPCVIFKNMPSRAGIHAQTMLDGFSGTIHVDAYAGYNRLTDVNRPDGAIALSYCWAHVRRKFKEVADAAPSDAVQDLLRRINALFFIERDIAGKPVTVRQTVRQKDALPIVNDLFSHMKHLASVGMRKSPMGKALAYALGLESGLRLYIHDGRLEISNNIVENLIRHVAIVRKNALFAGSEEGGQNWGILQSIITTAKLNGLNPEAYLTWAFNQMEQKLPRAQYHKLLPWNCPLPRYNE